jgi:hypothetical protein
LPRQSGLGQGGDRFQELAAMPDDGDANVFEVISSQLGQNIGRDFILTERLLVALQPQLSQPRQDIHGVFQQADPIGKAEITRTAIRAPTFRRRPIAATAAFVEAGLAD